MIILFVCICFIVGVYVQLCQSHLLPVQSGHLLYFSLAITFLFVGLLLYIYRYIAIGNDYSLFTKNTKNDSYRYKIKFYLYKISPILLMVWSIALGFLYTEYRAQLKYKEYLPSHIENKEIIVNGLIENMPQEYSNLFHFNFSVTQAWCKNNPIKIPKKISLNIYKKKFLFFNDSELGIAPPTFSSGNTQFYDTHALGSLQPGDTATFTVKLKKPHGNFNPNGFDYELWLWSQNIGATGYVKAIHKKIPDSFINSFSPKIPSSIAFNFTQKIEQTRQWIRHRLEQKTFDTPHAALINFRALPIISSLPLFQHAGNNDRNIYRAHNIISALVIGDQKAISSEDWDMFRRTGVTHLMSISGLHITLFAWLCSILIYAIWRYYPSLGLIIPAVQISAFLGSIFALIYAILSGFGIPAQRTVLMLSICSLLIITGKKWPWFYIWLFSALCIIIWQPWAILQNNFWLSFLAVGILFISNPNSFALFNKKDDSSKPSKLSNQRFSFAIIFSKCRKWLHSNILEQWVLFIVLIPLSMVLFGQISLIGFFSNILAIPLVTLFIVPLSILGVFVPGFHEISLVLTQILLIILDYFNTVSWANLTVPMAPWWIGLLGFLACIALFSPIHWHWRILFLPFFIPLLLWQYPRPAKGVFELIALDVGQGTAIVIRTQNFTLLYDTGPQFNMHSDAGERIVVPYLSSMGDKISALVLSHADNDHIGGAKAVQLAFQGDNTSFTSSIQSSHQKSTFWQLDAIHVQQSPQVSSLHRQYCHAGQHWQWDGVRFEILHPLISSYEYPSIATNARSCVLKITDQNNHSALLTGDIAVEQEAQIVQRTLPSKLKTNILIAPHHGSRSSSSQSLIDATTPRYVIFQSGYLNPYNHPHPEVIARYEHSSVQWFNTTSCGAAFWNSVTNTVECWRNIKKHYW